SYEIRDEEGRLIYPRENRQAGGPEAAESETAIALTPTPWRMIPVDSSLAIQSELRYFQLTMIAAMLVILVIFIASSTFVMRTVGRVFHQIRLMSKRLVNPTLDLSVPIHG